MTTLHRIIGAANLLFLALLLAAATLNWAVIFANTLGLPLIPFVLLLAFFTAMIWGVRNAFHYWGGPPKLTVMEHVLLAAGVVNMVLLLTAVGLFIYIGES